MKECIAFFTVLSVLLFVSACDAWTRAQGTIRDSTGRPIPDAVVTLTIGGDWRALRSDKDGHYAVQLPQPPVKVNVTLTAERAGYLLYTKSLKGPGIYRDLDVVLQAEEVTPQTIARAMFPSAREKARSVECFRGFSRNAPVSAVVEKCGRPDEELGSGVYIFVWYLADGSTISVNTPYLWRIDYINYTDASGRSGSLLSAKK
jgi:hypothetical protein